jgi:hypothetical protein
MEASMEPTPTTPDQDFLEELRRRRAELRESMSALEHALAAPPLTGHTHWAERVHVAVVELSADFREHIDITEGPDGLYSALRGNAPRLSGAVARLTREHALISELVDDLLGCFRTPDLDANMVKIRDLGTTLLGTLVRHRQRGSDLLYEAYAVDIGGET